MIRKLVPWLVASALFTVAALALQVRVPAPRDPLAPALSAGGGGPQPLVRPAVRSERWPARVRAGARWHDGAEFVLLTRTRTRRAEGVRTARERWVLLRRDSLGGDFERQRAGVAGRVEWLPFDPAPGTAVRHVGAARVHRCGGPLAPVTVPAGRFRCARTWREVAAPGGAVARVDEWWAPGVPVPVQRWTRPAGAVDTLARPPRRAADVRAGAEWAVLERIRRP